MGGGKYDYAGEYAKYKPEQDAQFEGYVDSKGDLAQAWGMVDAFQKGEDMSKFEGQGNPNLSPQQQAEYWIKRGATSKAAFGRSHAAEDEALRSGTYHGGKSGRTDVMPGTSDYTDYFGAGDTPDTRFEEYVTGENATEDTGPIWATARGGGAPGSANYPMGLVDYQGPSAMSGIPLDFQPWMQPDHIPDSLWNYQAPTLNEWEVERDWDWATKPASEYAPQDVASAVAAATEEAEGAPDQTEIEAFRSGLATGTGPYGYNPDY